MATRSYLDFAVSDFLAAKAIFAAGYYDHCVKLCQQAAEKYLKHIIEQQGTPADMLLLRSHKVHQLYDRACAILSLPVNKSIRSDMATLSDFYFDKSYPGDNDAPVSMPDAETAIQSVEGMVAAIGLGWPKE